MNWYRIIKSQYDSDGTEGNAYSDYAHSVYHYDPNDQYGLPESVLNDELWIFSNGRLMRSNVHDHVSSGKEINEWLHESVWPNIDSGRPSEKMEGYWKGRYDSNENLITVVEPMSQAQRNIPSVLVSRLEEAYPGATIKRYQ